MAYAVSIMAVENWLRHDINSFSRMPANNNTTITTLNRPLALCYYEIIQSMTQINLHKVAFSHSGEILNKGETNA